MVVYKCDGKAYMKMVLHVAKYPYLDVCGVIVGRKETAAAAAAAEDDRENVVVAAAAAAAVVIEDCFPLLHNMVGLSLLHDVGFTQIEEKCKGYGEETQIVGYYFASSVDNDVELKTNVAKIGEKIASFFPSACILTYDSSKDVSLHPIFRVFTKNENGNGFKQQIEGSLNIIDNESTLSSIPDLLRDDAHQRLVDFDDYLDDQTLDWSNSHLSRSSSTQKKNKSHVKAD